MSDMREKYLLKDDGFPGELIRIGIRYDREAEILLIGGSKRFAGWMRDIIQMFGLIEEEGEWKDTGARCTGEFTLSKHIWKQELDKVLRKYEGEKVLGFRRLMR